MKNDKFKPAAWFCGILLAATGLHSAGAAQPAPASEPKPDVKKTTTQLEEVMKLLRQGEKPGSGATTDGNPQSTQEPGEKAKAAPAASKAKPKP